MTKRSKGTEKSESGQASEPRFEKGMERLEGIIERLESGELALEEALKAFEEGVGLVRMLNEKLSEAEQRIEVLSRGEDGSLEVHPAEEDES